jgi:hypothetical protein
LNLFVDTDGLTANCVLLTRKLSHLSTVLKMYPYALRLPLISAVAVFAGICYSTHAKYYPHQVLWLPNGFVNLQEATENTKGTMEYMFFEEYISLIDENGVSVGGALVRDRSFIINYRGKYYVNAEKFYSALDKANQIAE